MATSKIITDDLDELYTDLLTVKTGTQGGTGNFVPDATPATDYACYIESESKLVRQANGTVTVSTAQVFVQGHPNLFPGLYTEGAVTNKLMRFTLPTRFGRAALLTAQSVEKFTDENGPLYEVVNFA